MESEMTTRPQPRLDASLTALLVILASETIFFGTLILAYLFMRSGQTNWPFANASLSELLLPGLNTLVLVISAVTAWRASRFIQQNDRAGLQSGLTITLLLGLLFVVGQVTEFTHSGLQISDAGFGGVYFALIGFHAVHVLAGVVALALILLRVHLGDFDAEHHSVVTAGAWFWYYVTAVWLVLFLVLFLV